MKRHVELAALVHSDRRRRREYPIRADAADAVPGKLVARRLALAFVALQKPRHEELLRERRQLHAAGLAVAYHPVGIVEVDHFDGRAWLRRVVRDLVVVARPARRAG